MRKRLMFCFIITLVLSLLSACGSTETEETENTIRLYFLSNDEMELIAQDYVFSADSSDTAAMVDELTAELKKTPEMLEYHATISGDVELIGAVYGEQLLTLNFAESYADLNDVTEILTRAALVRTYTQIPGIDAVAFQIEGNPLTDRSGTAVGNMTSDMFIYNAGREINTYEKVQLTLYFADESGKALIPVYRTVVYNSNILMERLIVEQLIAGPKTADDDIKIHPTINPSTGIVNISIRDGICYVNLDESFLTQTNPVSAEASIYSIVNSLAELPEVNRVQISVQGDTTLNYMDTMPLSSMYTRNLDVISGN